MSKKAIIIGAGPAGLTAAYELLKRTDIKPVILEKSGDIGGISKTINYKGNRMDIGGHRFFSKSDRVMNWWLNIMPVQPTAETYTTLTYQRNQRTIKQEESHSRVAPEDESKMMLIRKRLSRIYFLRKFFTYPIQLSIDTLRKLGPIRTLGILASYIKAQLFPRKPEKSLEDFLINRFGVKLYLLFFKDYTEKVWGVPCNEISAEWGAQRIKGVSISKAIQHAAQTLVKKKKKTDIAQKDTETSLIEQFLYPALGPGQLWEEVARQVQKMGGTIIKHESVKEILTTGNQVTGVISENKLTGEHTEYTGDYFFSTMPIQELIAGMNGQVPTDVKEIAAGLQYRDFITIGMLLKKLTPPDNQKILPDTWIYIQEKDVKVGRLQIFNNWSPYMVKDPNTVWLGMEYFCNEGDAFWSMTNEEIERTAIAELEKMGLAKVEDVLDSTVQRMEKTYPAYFGTYDRFDKIREYTDRFENLFLVGRNGMHKYNNSDHSMLTAMVAVDNICEGITSKENIWAINTEQEYHEKKKKNYLIDHFYKSDYNRQNQDNIFNEPKSFISFLFEKKGNKICFFIITAIVILQFFIFKYLYPYPSFINGDSYVYLDMANKNIDINVFPVGYPKFLRLFSVFSQSDFVLISFQYFFLQASLAFFLLTLFYIYRPLKTVRILLISLLLFNPTFLYVSNFISSDNLFISLSLIWFTILLWILYRPTIKLILLHAVILLLAFMTRYNALFYPAIACIAFLFSKYRPALKLGGAMLGIVIVCTFILTVSNKYLDLIGTRQFSPFSGWQMANNAMYAYRYVKSDKIKIVPLKFRQLDEMVRTYFDTTKDYAKHPEELIMVNTFYMWVSTSPLQRYMNLQLQKDPSAGSLKKWAFVAPLYADYGLHLMRQYPKSFFKYYLWPNTLKYYTPPIEFLSVYNMGIDTVKSVAKEWFGYNSKKIYSRSKNYKITVLNFFPILSGIFNIILLTGLVGFVILKGYRLDRVLWKTWILVISIWLANFSFSIFASPIALRFQLFPITICISFGILFFEYIVKASKKDI